MQQQNETGKRKKSRTHTHMFVNNIHKDVYEQGDTCWSFTTIKFNEIINVLYTLKFTKLLTHMNTH